MTDNQKQIEFAMRWLLEFGDGVVYPTTWEDNHWYQACDYCIRDWEEWDWLMSVDNDNGTIISRASLRLLKGDSDAQQ